MKVRLIESEELEQAAGIGSMYRDLIKAYYDMVDRITSAIVTLKDIGEEEGIEDLQQQILAIDEYIDTLQGKIDDSPVLEESARRSKRKKSSNINYIENAGDVPKNVAFFNHTTEGPDAASIGTADQVLSVG